MYDYLPFKLISVDNTDYSMIILNFDPKRVTQILFELQSKHISDKACYENDKYPIGLRFYFNLILERRVAF